jgi:hypothetical protein
VTKIRRSTVCVTLLATALVCVAPAAQLPTPAHQPPSPAVSQWNQNKEAVERVLGTQGYDPPLSVDIVDAFADNDHNLSVALVATGQGGAYTDEIVALRLERGVPVVARFRDAHRKPVPNAFLRGASVMHSKNVKLMPENRAVVDCSAESDSDGKPATCDAKAYVWNSRAKTFDLNRVLSKTISVEYCRELKYAP